MPCATCDQLRRALERMTAERDAAIEECRKRKGLEQDVAHYSERAEDTESANAALRERCTQAGRLLITEIGSDGPENVEATAGRAVSVIVALREQVSKLAQALRKMVDHHSCHCVLTTTCCSSCVAADAALAKLKEG